MAGSTTEPHAVARRLLDTGPSDYAPWFDRDACAAVIANHGLPIIRSEAWQHTNVGRWYETVLDAPRPTHGDAVWESPDEVVVRDFADARTANLFGPRQTFDLERYPLAAVNGLLLGGGLAIRVPAGCQASGPVRISRLPSAYQHCLVSVEAGATLELIEEPSPHTHRIVEAVVHEGAVLRHHRRQAAAASRECTLVGVNVAAGGRYELSQLSLGADLRRNDILVTLAGDGAETVLRSAWRVDGRGHLDNQVAVEHALPGGTSRQTYRGVAAGRARTVLNGRIHIAPGAQHSDATLSTKNLLADPTAEVYAKPELTIFANDVKCSHGATVGAIDEDAVHYFRSRGIPDDRARALFVRGFLREAIDDVAMAQALGVIA